MSVHMAEPRHQVVYQDLGVLLSKHANSVTAAEILAIAANMVGKLIALQDQRTMSKDVAMEIVAQNIEQGNAEIIQNLQNSQGGA